MALLRVWHWFLLSVAGVLIVFTGACADRTEITPIETQNHSPTPNLFLTDTPSVLPNEVAPPPTTTPISRVAANSRVDKRDTLEPSATLSMPQVSQTRPPSTEPAAAAATALPSPTPCSSPGQIKTSYVDSTIAGRINYRIYLPPCYSDTGRTYPVLYMLPGNIHSDSIWDELGLDEALEQGIKEKRFPPMLIVMVSGGSLANNTSGGPGSYEIFLIEEFIPYIEGTYCALPRGRGRAIGGLSRGGYWALEIAFRHPDAFTSVGGHSAALVDYNGGPDINPLDTGLNNDLDDLRVYFDIGQNDWLLPNIQELHEQMSSAGREHTWVLNEGIHEEDYWAAHVTDYLEWYSEPWLNPDIIYPPCRAISAGYSS